MSKGERRTICQAIALVIGITLLYMLSRKLKLYQHPVWIQGGMLVFGIALIQYHMFMYHQKKWSLELLYKSIILFGFAMRIGYMLYTGCEVREHDLRDLTSNGGGHAGYILTLIETGKLPNSNDLQYYQQPLFYILGSYASRIINSALRCTEPYFLVDAAKVVSCCFSCFTLLAAGKLGEILKLDKTAKVISIALIAFLPGFYLTGGSVVGDAQTAFFMTAAFLYTCRWHEKQSWKNILVLAVIYGLGMMTKISCGIMAIFTAGVFALVLWNHRKSHELGAIFGKYLAFGCISFPLGLWYSLRNYRLFGQTLGYVLRISEESKIYTGDHSLVQRFILPDIPNLLHSPYGDAWSDYNLPVYLIKSSLFGEFSYEISDWIPVILMLSGLILSVIVVISIIHQLRRRKTDVYGTFAAIAFGIVLSSTVYFYYQYPFGCSMDFRYVLVLGVLGALLVGKEFAAEKREWMRRVIVAETMIYSVFSCLMFLFIR
ncbi:MAG: glycosyltransferase family 39 protein [Lachnospiraceae bacterium]|nr:glycosyltransferase family 39 protein [Lachnospiraceae bacterium]